ncbi:hypothetical protein FQN57_001190 [Myotisia sp. PD_48]|nr:hypothetical protein FQN57_001190 [Myotisia sp. PD_48]
MFERRAADRYQLHRHRARSVVLTPEEMVEVRAAQRTFEGAYIRTSISQFSFALVVLKIFTAEFYSIGALFAVYGAGVMTIGLFRRQQGNKQFFAEVDENGVKHQKFRTSGNVVVVLTALSVAAYACLLGLTLALDPNLIEPRSEFLISVMAAGHSLLAKAVVLRNTVNLATATPSPSPSPSSSSSASVSSSSFVAAAVAPSSTTVIPPSCSGAGSVSDSDSDSGSDSDSCPDLVVSVPSDECTCMMMDQTLHSTHSHCQSHTARRHYDSNLTPPPSKTVVGRALGNELPSERPRGTLNNTALNPQPTHASHGSSLTAGFGKALADTPVSTAPPSPQITPRCYGSGASTPGKLRATTLDIPGLTKSKVSPDGRIAQRDVGSKLVIIMVGLPARGKSYITKKLCRYLNWLQHDARIFNVGERRRIVASATSQEQARPLPTDPTVDAKLRKFVRELSIGELPEEEGESMSLPGPQLPPPPPSAILLNDKALEEQPEQQSPPVRDPSPMTDAGFQDEPVATNGAPEGMDQSAGFFDPKNERAFQLREQVAIATLDELLDYILEQGGSVGILDATNSTLERRKSLMDHIRNRAGPELNVLFLESCCWDKTLLEANMRLKLSGPDYKDMEPTVALEDFKKRVKLYEKSYVALGPYEESHNMPYIQTIDVSRKVVAHQANGFMSSQVVYYLLNFNLSPRQIWISRHGESLDDLTGKIGGDSPLSDSGIRYAQALAKFIDFQRARWEEYQKIKALTTHFPPLPGDSTPPNPQYSGQTNLQERRNFCVWTSMLARSVETAQYFDEEEYDVKEMRMLDELNSGLLEGLTYDQIRNQYPNEFDARRHRKLHYRFPGPGGEGYLDVINRLRAVIIEVERMTDHVLLVGPRSVARTLLAYFLGLKREDLTDLAVPPGVIYSLEPKPYGVEYKVYQYDPETNWFDELPNYKVGEASYY